MTAKDVAQGGARKNPRYERLTSYGPYVVLSELRLPITKIMPAHSQKGRLATCLRPKDPQGDALQ
jgi:hypothetical protein